MSDILITVLVNGVALGAIYALISIGLNIIFGVMDFVNFAHGEYIMLSMYAIYYLTEFTGLNPLILLVVVIPVMFILGVITQRLVFQPVIDAPGTMQIFLSLGLLLVLQNAAQILFGSSSKTLSLEWAGETINIFGANLTYPRLAAIVLSIGATVALFVFLQRTHLGRVIRATAQDADGTELMGVNTKYIYMLTFGIGSALVAVASAPLAMIYYISPTVGVQFILIAFVVVVLGGLGNLKGGLYAGFFIGLLEAIVGYAVSPEIATVTYFALFILVLYARSEFGSVWSLVPKTTLGGVN